MISLDQISKLGLGTSRTASLGSQLSINEFQALLGLAAAKQVNLIDTSDFYGSGDSERLIRKGLAGRTEDFFIITKAGLPTVSFPGWLSPLNQVAKKVKQKAGGQRNYSAAYLVAAAHRSLKRLGVPALDAFLLHEPVWDDLAGTDAWEGLAKIREQGLARVTGISTNDCRLVEDGIGNGQVQLVQTFAAWSAPETDAIPRLCRAAGIPVIINQVMQPFQKIHERFQENEDRIHRLDGLAGLSCPVFLIASAILEKGAASALTGTTKAGHLEQNLRALDYLEPLALHLPLVNGLLL